MVQAMTHAMMQAMTQAMTQTSGQYAGVYRDEVVVGREIAHKIPGAGLKIAQALIDHHAFHAAQQHRPYVGRVAEMGVGATRTLGAEAGHDPAQALGPVARAKAFSAAGRAFDNEFPGFARYGGGHEWFEGEKPHGTCLALARHLP